VRFGAVEIAGRGSGSERRGYRRVTGIAGWARRAVAGSVEGVAALFDFVAETLAHTELLKTGFYHDSPPPSF